MSDETTALLEKSTTVRSIPWTVRALGRAISGVARVSPGLGARWAERAFISTRRYRPTRLEIARLERAHPFTVTAAGRTLQAWSWGAGPVALLVHGWNGRGSQLHAFVEPLVEAGYRVVTFDAIGHGASGGRQASLIEFARSIEAMIEAVGGVDCIIAHSMGALATTMVLATGPRVRAVVYLAPPEDPWQWAERFGELLALPPALVARMRERLLARGGGRWSDLRGSRLAAGLAVEALVFHDVADKEVAHAESTRLVASWSGARLRSTEGLGHRRLVRDPAVVSEAVAFLGRPQVEAAPAAVLAKGAAPRATSASPAG